MQVTRLRPRKKEDGTEKESCSRKKTLVSSTAMNQHQPHPGSPGTQPHGFGLLLISHSLDIRKHKKGLEEFHPPGGQCFTVHSFFFFYPICKVGTKYLSYSLFLDKVAFKSYSPLSFPPALLFAHTMEIK